VPPACHVNDHLATVPKPHAGFSTHGDNKDTFG
jgi:hypothetical protein